VRTRAFCSIKMPMPKAVDREVNLPGCEERRALLIRASLVLAQARTLAAWLDSHEVSPFGPDPPKSRVRQLLLADVLEGKRNADLATALAAAPYSANRFSEHPIDLAA
jgi:hypothetical protein